MKWHQLKPLATKNPKRVGRGIGSGHGKTAGRGTKGQGSRSGAGTRPGFEGGQNPLMQRLPKQRGFKSMRPVAQIIKTSQLSGFKPGSTVDSSTLVETGLVATVSRPVRLLFDQALTGSLHVKLDGASRTARAAVTKAGGKFEQVRLKPTTSRSRAVKGQSEAKHN